METVSLSLQPARHPAVALGPGLLRGTRTVHVVLDRRANRLYEIGAKEHFILSQLDGVRSLSEIGEGYAARFGRRLEDSEWARILTMLGSRNFLAGGPASQASAAAPQSAPGADAPSGLLRGHWVLGNVSALVDRMYRWLRPLFSAWFVVPLLIAIVAMLIVLVIRLPALISQMRFMSADPGLVLPVLALLWLSAVLHEFAHALTARHYGGHASEIGVRWNLPLVYLYCKVNDVLVFPLRRQRVCTAAAGAVTNLALMLPFFACWLAWPPGDIRDATGTLLLAGSAMALLNYLPWPGLDGYAVISHAMNVNHLSRESYRYLRLLVRGREARAAYSARARHIYLGYPGSVVLATAAMLAVAFWLARRAMPGSTGPVAVGAAAGAMALGAAGRWLRIRTGTARADRTARAAASVPAMAGTAEQGTSARNPYPRSRMRHHLDPSTAPAVSLSGVRKAYGDVSALAGVSLTVRKGEFFGIIGPNGAGKTTLIEIMEGLRKADSGQVSVLGERPWPRNRSLLPRLGVHTQEPAFFVRLTAVEHLETVAALYGKGVAEAREQLALVGLTASAGTLVDRMSVGQRQRLAIAAALVHGPELIFLDEPTAALDPQARRELWEVLRGIAIQGRTIIYTTHHMEEAEALCDRIALISKGTVVALDEPANLVRGLKAPTQVVVPCTQISANQARRLAGADVVTVDNGSVVIQTQAVGLVLGAIGQVPGITEVQTIAPNLEDVYLRLTRTEHGS